MELRKNCWEVMKCGKEQGGINVDGSDACPAALPHPLEGLNHGKYFGRSCWMIPATRCNQTLQGSYFDKIDECMVCPFFSLVAKEEERFLTLVPPKKMM